MCLDVVSEINPSGSPFESYIVFSLGYFMSGRNLSDQRLMTLDFSCFGTSAIHDESRRKHQVSASLSSCAFSCSGILDLCLRSTWPRD